MRVARVKSTTALHATIVSWCQGWSSKKEEREKMSDKEEKMILTMNNSPLLFSPMVCVFPEAASAAMLSLFH